MAFAIAVDTRDWRFTASALLAACFFAVHPLRVESVVWATERRDVLSGGFFLIALYCYLRANDNPAAQSKSRYRWLAGAVAAHLLSLLAKATAITLPLLLLVLDVYPLQRLRGSVHSWFTAATRPLWLEKLPFLLLSLIFGTLALSAQHASGALRPVQQYFLSYRLGQAFYGICFYLWKTIVPIGLSPLYELPYDFAAWTATFVVCAAVTLAISALVYFTRRCWPWLGACWVAYLIVVAPVLGVAQSGVQLVADRYSYLSCLGWAVLLGGICFYWLRRFDVSQPYVVTAAIVAAVAGLALMTRGQITIWHDGASLWKHALQVAPDTAIANYNLGKYYETNGAAQNSVELYRRAVVINPTYADAHYNLARLLGQQGQLDDAIAHYREALKFKPDDVETHNNLGYLLAQQGNFTAASASYHKALALDPDYAKAYFNLGRLFVRTGDLPKAIDNFQHALKLTPDTAEVHAGLGDAFARAGNVDQAIIHLTAALQLKPQLAGVQTLLAQLLEVRGGRVAAGTR
jgi:Flp pilus assembly protein TadD